MYYGTPRVIKIYDGITILRKGLLFYVLLSKKTSRKFLAAFGTAIAVVTK